MNYRSKLMIAKAIICFVVLLFINKISHADKIADEFQIILEHHPLSMSDRINVIDQLEQFINKYEKNDVFIPTLGEAHFYLALELNENGDIDKAIQQDKYILKHYHDDKSLLMKANNNLYTIQVCNVEKLTSSQKDELGTKLESSQSTYISEHDWDNSDLMSMLLDAFHSSENNPGYLIKIIDKTLIPMVNEYCKMSNDRTVDISNQNTLKNIIKRELSNRAAFSILYIKQYIDLHVDLPNDKLLLIYKISRLDHLLLSDKIDRLSNLLPFKYPISILDQLGKDQYLKTIAINQINSDLKQWMDYQKKVAFAIPDSIKLLLEGMDDSKDHLVKLLQEQNEAIENKNYKVIFETTKMIAAIYSANNDQKNSNNAWETYIDYLLHSMKQMIRSDFTIVMKSKLNEQLQISTMIKAESSIIYYRQYLNEDVKSIEKNKIFIDKLRIAMKGCTTCSQYPQLPLFIPESVNNTSIKSYISNDAFNIIINDLKYWYSLKQVKPYLIPKDIAKLLPIYQEYIQNN